MPKMSVKKSIHIDAPVEKAFNAVADLGTWNNWSPWTIMDPDCEVTVKEGGKAYSWDGPRVGAGNMKVLSETPNQSVDYDLTFLRPMESTAEVRMEVKEKDGGSEVTWLMDSHLPFFLFFKKKKFEMFIGMDYERGLLMLKDYVETGSVPSKLNFLGKSDYEGCLFVGKISTCRIEDMPETMKANFEEVMAWGVANGRSPEDGIAVYHDYDLKRGITTFTSGVKVDEKPKNIPSGFVFEEQYDTKLMTVEHIGPYRHLGNAWSTLQTMIRNKEFKTKKHYHPFETYGNSPKDTPENELITRIHFSVR